jgi:DNA-binding CsgD family transcriptional regulator/tetratricopeptide (TPR) repeat protein
VHGEAGVGKTRLVREVCGDPELLVLWGACVHFGGGTVPYAPIIGVLQDWHAGADPAERSEVLAGADELGALLPALGTERIAPTIRLIPLIDLVLNRIAERHRTVVVIDDLHWADVASLDVLAYVVTGFRGQRLTVLGTCRDENRGEGHPLHSWLADMRRTPGFEEIHLDRLELDATAIQLEQLLGQAADLELAAQVQSTSGGNPYLTELLVHQLSGTESVLPATVPEALRDALLAAWHRLSAPTRQLVRVLAVGGRPTALPVLAAVASEHGSDSDGLSACLAEARVGGVLRAGSTDEPWFRHPLLAEVLYAELAPPEAARIHATYVRMLEPQAGPADAADLAVHSQHAGHVDDTYRWSKLAADHAKDLRAPAEQAIQLIRMCELWEQVSPTVRGTATDRAELVLEVSKVCIRVGRHDTAIDLLNEVISLVDRDREPLQASNLLIDRSILRWHRTEPIEAVLADIQQARELTAPYPDSAEHARVLAELGSAESWIGDPEAMTHADAAVRIARGAGSERVLAQALAERASVIIHRSPELALADARAAEPLARSSGSMGDLLNSLVWQVNALLCLGRIEEATEVALRGYADLAAPGPDLFAYFLAYLACEGLLQSGRWMECRELLRTALSARCVSIAGGVIRLMAASLAVRCGRLPEARQHFDRARELISDDFLGVRVTVATGGAEVLVGEGKPLQALHWLGSKLTPPGGAPTDGDDDLLLPYANAAAEAARMARDAGDPAAAVEAVSMLGEVVSDWPWEPFTTVRPDVAVQAMNRRLFLAEVARCRDDPDQPDRWRAAFEACEAANAPWHQAVAQWRCAEATVAAGQPAVSVSELMRQAHHTAAELGAEPLQDSVEALARRTRISLRQPAPVSFPDQSRTLLSALTGRELEILGFLVAGRSNGEIAKELFISGKTVSVHVSNILRKTGTTSRLEAAALAERLGDPGG